MLIRGSALSQENSQLNNYLSKVHPVCSPTGSIYLDPVLMFMAKEFNPNEGDENIIPVEIVAELTGKCITQGCLLRGTQNCPLINRKEIIIG